MTHFMKKNILRGTGALALVVAGMFVGKAAVKSQAAGIYYSDGTLGCQSIVLSNTDPSFAATGTNQAFILTSGGSNHRLLYSTSGCTSNGKLFFTPHA